MSGSEDHLQMYLCLVLQASLMKRSQRLRGTVYGGDALRLKILHLNNAMIWWMKEPQVKIHSIPNRSIIFHYPDFHFESLLI